MPESTSQASDDGTTVETLEDETILRTSPSGVVLRTLPDGTTEECAWGTQPTSMFYVDGNGVKQNKYLPLGFAKRSGELLMAKNWDELAKLPDYTGQKPHEGQLRTSKEIDDEAREPAKL